VREVRPSAGGQLMAGAELLMTIVTFAILAVGSPLVTFLVLWWSANWEHVRTAEATLATDDAGERLS
jgi:hypothetical protein